MTDALPAPRSEQIFPGTSRERAGRLGVIVVHDIVTAIVTGALPEKALLPIEAELSSHFGVSRTVIREAIRSIEEKGMITVVRKSGTTVRHRDHWNLLDPVVLQVMLENDASLGVLDDLAIVRSSLEGAMAAATAQRRTPAEVAELESALHLMAVTVEDIEKFSDADRDFHAAVMSFSQIPLAEGITKTLYSRARETARFTRNATRAAFDATLEEHERVLDAIRDGDRDRAEAAMRFHILEAWERRRPPTERKP